MAQILEITAPSEAAGTRLDKFLSTAFPLSRSAAERLLEEGKVEVLGGEANKKYVLHGEEHITLTIADPAPMEATPENIPLDVVYEDDDIIVINKPQGMVVHPAAGNTNGTLVNALLYRCGASLSGIGGVIRPGIVHRIDKDTSGLLVVAKHDAAHQALAAQLKTHAISRVYEAIVLGNLKEDKGTVHAPIGRHPNDRKKMAICRREGEGRDAVTHYTVLARFGQLTHIRCELETGRTHQIRVHMAHIGHPLLGDPVYGGDGTKWQAQHKALFCGQCLHACTLSLTHPMTGDEMTFHAPLPENFATILTLLAKESTP